MNNLRRKAILVLCLIAVGSGVAACGGSGNGTAGTGASHAAQLDRSDRAFLAFTRCMRRHGVKMRDPYHRAGHSGLTLDFPVQTPANVRAGKSCGNLIAAIVAQKMAAVRAGADGVSYRRRAAVHLGLLHYARCMRAHAIPMLDPDAYGNLNLGNVPGSADVGRYTPLFRRSDRSCRRYLPAGVSDNGTGP